jgi:hypothetical protein
VEAAVDCKLTDGIAVATKHLVFLVHTVWEKEKSLHRYRSERLFRSEFFSVFRPRRPRKWSELVELSDDTYSPLLPLSPWLSVQNIADHVAADRYPECQWRDATISVQRCSESEAAIGPAGLPNGATKTSTAVAQSISRAATFTRGKTTAFQGEPSKAPLTR